MSKNQYETYVSPAGILVWPRLNEPDAYQGKGELKYKTAVDFEVGATITVDEQEIDFAQFIEDLGNAHALENKKGSRMPQVYLPFGEALDRDKNEIPGVVRVNFQIKAVTETHKGPWDRKPAFFNAEGVPFEEEPMIGGGTVAKIAFQVYTWSAAGKLGITLQPLAVQIIELVTRKSGEGAGKNFKGFSPVTSMPNVRPYRRTPMDSREDTEDSAGGGDF